MEFICDIPKGGRQPRVLVEYEDAIWEQAGCYIHDEGGALCDTES